MLNILILNTFQDIACEELWIEFTTWNSTRYIPIHELASALGPVKSRGLLMFHALTGCDTNSNLGIGKQTAWAAWKNYPEADEVFKNLGTLQNELDEDQVIEKFFLKCYDKNLDTNSVQTAREILHRRRLRSGGASADNLPPTQEELVQHVKRSVYQAGYVWGQALLPAPRYPSPEDHGWMEDSATGDWKAIQAVIEIGLPSPEWFSNLKPC